VGCSKKESSGSGAVTNNNAVTPVAGGSNTNFVPDSFAIFNSFAGRTVVNPTGFAVNLNVFNVADPGHTAQYGGQFTISYLENGIQKTDTFSSGTSVFETQYNKWATTGGSSKLKLFFQDALGGVIVILRQVVINDFTYTLQGDVYFRNFDLGICQQPPEWLPPQCQQQSGYKCWNISAGPYDCRAFLSSGNVRPDIVDAPGFGDHQGGYAGPGWQHLGTFTGLDLSTALNGT